MVWSSPYEPIEPGRQTFHATIAGDRRARWATTWRSIDGPSGAAISYAELAARIDRAAAGLAARGLRPGDVLALWAAPLARVGHRGPGRHGGGGHGDRREPGRRRARAARAAHG